MSVTVRGRVPSQWNDQTVAHLTERLRALETAVAGGKASFTSPSAPPFGPGAGVVVVSTPGSGGVSGGVTDHGALMELSDDDHPQYLDRRDGIDAHQHGPFDVAGLDARFPNRGEAVRALPHPHVVEDVSGMDQFKRHVEGPIPHTHRAEEIHGLPSQGARPETRPHQHVMVDVADLAANDAQFVFASRVYGG